MTQTNSQNNPSDQQTLTPYLAAINAAAAIDFYKNVFGAVEIGARIADGNGVVGHATLQIGNSQFSIAEEYGSAEMRQFPRSPQSLNGTTIGLALTVDNVDAVMQQAEQAGATILTRPENQFYGHRTCRLLDPFQHLWHIRTVIEDVSDDELLRRAQEFYQEEEQKNE